MPTYVYACRECGATFEKFQRFSDEPLTICPRCQSAIHRVFQPVGIVFKGSGWYVNDSRSANSAAATATTNEKTNGETATTAETKPSEAATPASEPKATPPETTVKPATSEPKPAAPAA